MFYKRLIINGTEYRLAVNQSGAGVPGGNVQGTVGVLYMNTDDGSLYKCTGIVDGRYIWQGVGSTVQSGRSIYVGDAAPADTTLLWVDTDDDTEGDCYSKSETDAAIRSYVDTALGVIENGSY